MRVQQDATVSRRTGAAATGAGGGSSSTRRRRLCLGRPTAGPASAELQRRSDQAAGTQGRRWARRPSSRGRCRRRHRGSSSRGGRGSRRPRRKRRRLPTTAAVTEQHERQRQRRRRHGLQLGVAPPAALQRRDERQGAWTAACDATEPGDEPGPPGLADGSAVRRRVRVRLRALPAVGGQRANSAQVLVKRVTTDDAVVLL